MARQLRLSLGREGPPSFDDFARGPSNARALAAVEAWPAWRDGCLAIVGPKGAGKSHLARAWAEAVGALVLEPETPDVIAAAGRPVLLEDADRGVSTEGLFHLINLAARAGGGLLLTARTLPATWPTALPDLRSRLNAFPVAEIEPPDDAVLEGVLRRFFRDRNIRPPEEVYPYLLARMSRSIPDAAEVVRRLDEAGDAGFRPVTRVLARQILDD
ncbi:MAG: chromosomal replication initiator DnaA [Alphaproteobacteria bacterium]|nr:chromosomal replication initiator DnaA [Alphaproteobacteria bacterium]MBU1513626.1 chromosomal replication initiator DnaA [Alphaproteobacteria bacterium]MBU2094729.1 chromosomal replication initiator DnaA [Alphaproteobacteria bacterium]MBU2150202.1 chromosomal replication initiator DnaA [Alphaproteobacteria bacterium]MBU2309269.1 chromosomal replication initiator DnaA [Alphaproteobacteria bacterium]